MTPSRTDADRYLARNTSVYYVADADQALYTPSTPVRTKVSQVVGGQ